MAGIASVRDVCCEREQRTGQHNRCTEWTFTYRTIVGVACSQALAAWEVTADPTSRNCDPEEDDLVFDLEEDAKAAQKGSIESPKLVVRSVATNWRVCGFSGRSG